MDFSFSFMQGIMGNTIQQPPQLIDSANIRQEDVYNASSELGGDGGRSAYESALETGFCYPPSAPEDLPGITNGYLPAMGLCESQTKYGIYSQFPNGSANGYNSSRNYGGHCLVPGEGNVLRASVLQEKPAPSSSPVTHHHQHHHQHQQQSHIQNTNSALPTIPQTHLFQPHLVAHAAPLPVPPPVALPTSPPVPSQLDGVSLPFLATPPPNACKKTGSPEIKLKIIKTYHNGRELFESALCGDLLDEVRASEASRRRHERKEKRKRNSSRPPAQNLEPEGQQMHPPEDCASSQLVMELSQDGLTEGPSEQQTDRRPKEEPEGQKHVPSVITGSGSCEDHEVGDLVWAKVGTYPWWPCMVSCDPQSKAHTRINTRGHQEYHVQFFGSVPERAWIHEKRVVVYQGQHQFEELQADTLRKTSNPTERHKLLKPVPQRERAQWKVGVGHAEDAFLMTREERIETYTFIYVDEEPQASPTRSAKAERRVRRSQAEEPGSVTGEQQAGRQRPRRQCSQSSAKEPSEEEEEEEEEKDPLEHPHVPSEPTETQAQSPPVKTAWKTAAARKVLPLSITMKKLNVEVTKCDWPLSREHALSLRGTDANFRQLEPGQGCSSKGEVSYREEDQRLCPLSRRSESSLTHHMPSEVHTGSVERKQQRRSIRSRSDSEKGMEPVAKKKVKRDQVEAVPQTSLKTGSQKGASEISDSCKPLKKRSRASTDVETASSQYRDTSTSDSDSRGLSDPQALFDKCPDSPTAADGSDTQSVDSGLSQLGCGALRKDTVCQICETYGDELVSCEGLCYRMFHLQCLGFTSAPEGKFTCQECSNGSHTCFSCKVPGGEVRCCSVSGCGRFYHEPCLRTHPGTGAFSEPGAFRCPQHCCATCCLDRDLQKACRGRVMRCLRCPVAYHTGDSCVAAGSIVVTPHVIICSGHSGSKKNGHLSSAVNVAWCFACARGLLVQDHTDNILSSYAFKCHYLLTESNRAELMKLPMIPSSSSATKKNIGKGGRLLSCELCPASFHPECLSIEMPEGSWRCSECRAGKRPHYKQIVWVKLGSYRWWPAEICSPRLVPLNIQTLKHDIGEFPVFFFGSHDYYWIGRGRVFPYTESDKNFAEGQTGVNVNKTFKKALEEAARRFQELKAQRESRETLEQERGSRRPPQYKFIRSNKPVGKVQLHVADLSEIPRCNCRPTDERPCGMDSQCLNRMLQYECHQQVCPAGERCRNQSFSRRAYPDTEVFRTEGCGWGLRTKQPLRKGDFVLEYVGELIDSEECKLRIKRAHENHATNYYMLTLTKDRVIDAGPKGNVSRFMNHSCSPNCETQKWTVNGDMRIGLFALCDIEAEDELTFNYNLDCLGNGRTKCHCASENCSGFLGVRPKSAVVMEKEEKARVAKLKPRKRKLKPENRQTHEYFCFCCGEGGELVMCDRRECPKAYHLLCLNLTQPPFGRWECPWHQCSVCQRAASSFCQFCPSSFCREHERGALTASALDGRPCCFSHNPRRPLELRPQEPGHIQVKEEPPEPGD